MKKGLKMEKMLFLHILVIWRILRKSRKKNRQQKICFSRGGFVLNPLKKRKSLLFRGKNCIFFLCKSERWEDAFHQWIFPWEILPVFCFASWCIFCIWKRIFFSNGACAVEKFHEISGEFFWLAVSLIFLGLFSLVAVCHLLSMNPENWYFWAFLFQGEIPSFPKFCICKEISRRGENEEKRRSWPRGEGEKLQESPFLFCWKVFKLRVKVPPHELSKKCHRDFPGVVFFRELWRNWWISGSLLFSFLCFEFAKEFSSKNENT